MAMVSTPSSTPEAMGVSPPSSVLEGVLPFPQAVRDRPIRAAQVSANNLFFIMFFVFLPKLFSAKQRDTTVPKGMAREMGIKKP